MQSFGTDHVGVDRSELSQRHASFCLIAKGISPLNELASRRPRPARVRAHSRSPRNIGVRIVNGRVAEDVDRVELSHI